MRSRSQSLSHLQLAETAVLPHAPEHLFGITCSAMFDSIDGHPVFSVVSKCVQGLVPQTESMRATGQTTDIARLSL